jgi:uncharacterized SAM-binding protein YcdF (DUF218 family)
MKKLLTITRRIILLSLAGALLYTGITLFQIWHTASRDDAAPADAIVVLGTSQWVGRPSPVLRARLDHAIELYHAGYAPLLITTGGYGRDPNFSEAGVGATYAQQRGVPAQAILMEEVGSNTWESMVEVARLARAHEVERIIVVSDPFHIERIKMMARNLDLEPLGSPTRSSPISRRPTVEFGYFLREAASITLHQLGIIAVVRVEDPAATASR